MLHYGEGWHLLQTTQLEGDWENAKMWIVASIVLISGGTSLDHGARALSAFEFDAAVHHLEAARNEGPYAYDRHVELYEKLGIAYASVDRKADAVAAFEQLLALDPGHAIPYTLAPKVTFVFERLRRETSARQPATLQINWPLELHASQAVPITIEPVADPKRFLKRARLFFRRNKEPEYRAVDVNLPPVGESVRVVVPPATGPVTGPDDLLLYLVASDAAGSEVLRIGDASNPRRIAVKHEEPTPWYARWWFLTAAGVIVAAGTGAAVYLGTREPPDSVGGRMRVQ